MRWICSAIGSRGFRQWVGGSDDRGRRANFQPLGWSPRPILSAVALVLAWGMVRAEDEPVKLESLVVTGSNLPSAGETPVAPVTIFSSGDIARSGVTNDLLQVVRKVAPQFSGSGNVGGANANVGSGSTNGGSQLALRNLATLVLVNGRRLAAAPVGATGGEVFVDVNAIPVSAIARIEILTDGASAIYGSDAVSGVVNIILKTDFDGAEVGGRFGRTDNLGHYRERSAWGVVGGQLGEKGARLTAAYEWSRTDPLYNFQRPFATPSYGTTNFAGVIQLGELDAAGNFIGDPDGYYYLDPALKAPAAGSELAERGYDGPLDVGTVLRTFDLSRFVTMLIGSDKNIFTLSGDQRFSERLSAFGDIVFSRTSATSQLAALPIAVTLAASHPANILGRDVSVRNRFEDYPRLYTSDTDAWRAVGGLRGAVGDAWTWETAVTYSGATQDFANSNLVRTAAREEAVNSGALNLFAREQPAEVLERLFGSATGKFRSELVSWDLRFVGADVVSLPGGGVDFAAGIETREETLQADSNVESRSATFAYDSGTTIDPFDEGRRVSSVFAEMNLPLVGDANRRPGIHSLDMTLAVRHERYSDTDDPTVPKIALRYQPVGEDWVWRLTYSRSFAAPALYELNAPTGTGFTNSLAEFGSNQAQLQTLPVESLMPSRSRNFSAGMVWTPKAVAGLSLSVDYFAIEQTDVISNLNAAGVIDQVFHDIEVNGASSPYASMLHVGGYTGPTVAAPGQLSALGIDNFYFVIPAASNLGAQRLDGADVRLAYERAIGEGRLRWDSATTYYRRFDVQVAPGAPFTRTAGLVTGLNGSIPRWRSYNALTWTWRAWSVGVAHTYYAAMRDATWTPAFLPDYPQRIPAYSVFDTSVSYEWKGGRRWLDRLQLTIGVNNIGDRLPAKSATFDGIANADVSEFDPIGRLYYVAARHRF